MAILTTSGRSAMASAVKSRPLFLAWGAGQTWWDSTITQPKTFTTNSIATDYPNLDSLIVKSADGTVTYVANTDYTVDAVNGIITRLTNGAIPPGAVVNLTYVPHRAPEDPDASTLIAPLGYRPVTEVDFVVEDAVNGTIQLTSGKYAVSVAATPELYTRTSYDYEDGAGSVIRELALYQDVTTNPALPLGQQYFQPSDLTSPGILLALQHIAPLTRDAAVKQTFEFVLVI